MKRILLLFLLTAALLVAGTVGSMAQAPAPALGDYGSVVTGMWDSVSTWKMYSTNGAFDSAATAAPSSGRNVYILTGTTVTYQTSSQNCKNLVVQAGATLQSNGTLPTSAIYLKINGSKVWVEGNLGSGPTDALSLETKYNGTITLAGSGSVNIGQVRPNSGQTGTMAFEFAMNANLNYNGSSGQGGAGIYTTRGTQTSSTITIDSAVTVTFAPGSHFELQSSSSALGGMNTTLNVNGTLNAPASSIILADSVAYTATMNIGSHGVVNVGKALTPFLTGGGVATINVADGGKLNIVSPGTADFTNPDAKVVGGGTFALQGGATIKVGAAAGLDSAAGPIQTGRALLDTLANYSYVGTGVQFFGKMLPDSINNLTIGASSIDTVAMIAHDTLFFPRKVKGVLQIDGHLVNNGGLVTFDTAIVNGTYQHNTSDGAVPTAVWKTGSLFLLSAPNTALTTGIVNGNQNYYNFTVDAPTLSGVGRLGFDGNTISGNLVIHNTNDSFVGTGNYIAMAPKTGGIPVTVMGDLLIDSSAAQFSIGYGSGAAHQTLIVHGKILSKGRLYLNGSGVSNNLVALGDLFIESIETDAFRGHSAPDPKADTLWFAGSGNVQRFIKPTSVTMSNLQVRVVSGAALYLDDTTIVNPGGSNPGTFTLEPNATLICGNPMGIDGAIQPLGATILSPGANYEFRSTTAQVTGFKLPPVVKNLTINDSLGVTLSDTVSVTDTLQLEKGNLTTNDSSMISIATGGVVSRTNNYVVGRLQKQFGAPGPKDFEVGTIEGYTPVLVTVNTGSGAMSVAAVRGRHPNTFDTTKTLAEYWSLQADTAITNADLRFTYLPSDVNGQDSIYGAWKYSGSGTTWTSYASVLDTTAHTVTVAGVTSFSDWTLGESPTVSVKNPGPLPIPAVFYVDQNYPNPFNPTTKISYGLPKDAYVSVVVYNMLGQKVATLHEGEQKAGVHTINFDATRLASGAYFYRVAAGNSVSVKRMLVLK